MAGLIREMIDSIIEQKSKGDQTLASMIKVRLLLKGIDPNKYTPSSLDDPSVIQKLQQVALDFHLTLQ